MKPIVTYLLLAAALIVAAICGTKWYQTSKELSEQKRSFNDHSSIVTESNTQVLDSIRKENTILANAVLKYRNQVDSLLKLQKQVVNDSKKVRDEISITPDSGQLAILYRLLAEHRSAPIERD